MVTNKLKISGKVQGVYFRASAKQKALNLGITGFVQNSTDGTVQLEVEGEEKAVADMINWCKKGPGLARVLDVEVTQEASKNFVSFDIRK